MADELRRVDPAPYLEGLDLADATEIGTAPEFRWIAVSELRVDPTYQRDVNRRGASNIRSIARKFDWRKFGIVIVAPLGDGSYAIVDGQHRTFGAACRGIERVPCLIIEADSRAQAAAFVSINSQLTLMTPLQIHASRLAAGDAGARALVDACDTAGVRICRYPVPGNKMSVGETLAVSILYRMLEVQGAERLGLVLRCVTRTHDGNPGMLRAALIKALCAVLSENPGFAKSERKLIAALNQIHLETEFDAAGIESRKRKASMEAVLKMRLASQIERSLMPLAA